MSWLSLAIDCICNLSALFFVELCFVVKGWYIFENVQCVLEIYMYIPYLFAGLHTYAMYIHMYVSVMPSLIIPLSDFLDFYLIFIYSICLWERRVNPFPLDLYDFPLWSIHLIACFALFFCLFFCCIYIEVMFSGGYWIRIIVSSW